jgi:hypothetical protein
MQTFKKIIFLITWSFIILVVFFTIYFSIKGSVNKNKINSEGIETVGTIQTKWRGRCGSGYGYSATFKVEISGYEREFVADCGVPNEVQIGDMYLVKYLKDDPNKHIIFFEKKIKTIPEK